MLKKTIGMGGFTLAEVLITLGIIGVVAAMTMPTLINSTQGAQYKTAYKKALTVLSQAVVMNIALNDYDLSQVVGGTVQRPAGGAEVPDGQNIGAQSLYSLFKPRLNIVREANGQDFNNTPSDTNQWIIVSDTDNDDYTAFADNHKGDSENAFPTITIGDSWPDSTIFMMNDGITFIFDNTQSNCIQADENIGVEDDSYCYGFIDVNGQKAPNRVVQCDGGFEHGDTVEGTAGDDDATCQVSSPTDIYPIAMYNQSVIPASAAARAVLYNK